MINIFIDIETIPSEVKPSLDEIKAPANYKDEAKILAYKIDNQEEEWKKQALLSHAGRIICIGYALNDDPAQIISGSEREITLKFSEILSENKNKMKYFIGHNIRAFDLKFLQHRLWKYGSSERFPRGKYSGNILDTMVEFGCNDYRDMTSLSNVAKFFDLPAKAGKGSDVFDWWQKGELDTIYEYCKGDVELVRLVAKKMNLVR